MVEKNVNYYNFSPVKCDSIHDKTLKVCTPKGRQASLDQTPTLPPSALWSKLPVEKVKSYGLPALWFQGGPRIIALIVQDSQLLNGLVLGNHSGVGRDTPWGSLFMHTPWNRIWLAPFFTIQYQRLLFDSAWGQAFSQVVALPSTQPMRAFHRNSWFNGCGQHDRVTWHKGSNSVQEGTSVWPLSQ